MLIPGQRIHFVGIGGIGMSAIARVMLHQGYVVSGSDLRTNTLTEGLAQDGATIFLGHGAGNIAGAELVIISTAVKPDNPEVVAAKERGIPVKQRIDMLGDLMQGYRTIAVAGTHGKTTTTSMIVHILRETGFDPTFIVGGIVPSVGLNADIGQSDIFVIEADEYGYMFLGLNPTIGVITNVEHDHPDMFPTMNDLVDAFNQFAALIPHDGLLIACADDPIALTLAQNRLVVEWPVTTYGIANTAAEWQASDAQPTNIGGPSEPAGMNFTLSYQGGKNTLGRVMLRVPGMYNVQNALAALVVVDHLGVSLADALAALTTFTGASRRFEVRGQKGGVTVIDDYAHHPSAIRLTLQAARATYPKARIWAVWQPHTYTRLRTLFEEFTTAFEPDVVDQLLVTDVYAAREKLSAGLDVADFMHHCPHPAVRHTPTLDDAVAVLKNEVEDGDIVLILSAGDAPQIGEQLLKLLA